MFAIGFLIAGALFLAGLFLASRLLPKGKWRLLLILGVLAAIVLYPFLHLVRPSYAKFRELCLHPSPPTIVKTKAVDFILLDGGYSSDCTKGPAYIAKLGYRGFDCRQIVGSNSRHEVVAQLYRYTKRPSASPDCGLECFDVEKIAIPEANFGYFDHSSRARGGYMAGDERRVTIDYPISKEDKQIPFWRWLLFNDSILVDVTEGDMAFTTDYYYLPYGPITILGLASGSAPAEQCPRNSGVDPRNVYTPKSSSK
jgi:hypothetical protein